MTMSRHAPLGRQRPRADNSQQQQLPHAYLGKTRRRVSDVYSSDHSDSRRSGRFRWLLSTCLAAGVGVVAVLVVMAGSMGTGSDSTMTQDLRPGLDAPETAFRLPAPRDDGLKWALPKSDRLQVASGALSTKFIIQDTMRRKQGKQDFIVNKPFARIVARLAPVPVKLAEKIPAFNPYKLYANVDDGAGGGRTGAGEIVQNIAVRIVDLLGGMLPQEDGQEIDTLEAGEIAARAQAIDDEPLSPMRPSFRPEGTDRLSAGQAGSNKANGRAEPAPAATTVLGKTTIEADDGDDEVDNREVHVVRASKGDTLSRILTKFGAEAWQTRAMVEAAKPMFADAALVAGMEVHVTAVPSVSRANRLEAVRVSVFGEGQDHKVTVARNGAGDFTASTSPIDERLARASMDAEDKTQTQSLYTSLYHAAQSQDLSAEAILQVMRIHAFEADFRRRVRAGDTVELFYDMKDDDKGADGALGDLLASSLTTAGETHRFYRFRTPDGVVDYYDEYGNTSRKFLMRRPVRGETVRLASGFGMRRHPLLPGVVRMHAGVDWAGPTGTPIMAAGSGSIEEAGRKGEYGNYVRIRHPNGYKSSYAHMSRIAPGIGDGVRVRQGQLIGYIGNTGLSAGPHLHFEIMVNNQHVDPMSIQVPRERQLSGKPLQDFVKERARVDDLMRRVPVSSKVADAGAR